MKLKINISNEFNEIDIISFYKLNLITQYKFIY